jgi:hypothetical protein
MRKFKVGDVVKILRITGGYIGIFKIGDIGFIDECQHGEHLFVALTGDDKNSPCWHSVNNIELAEDTSKPVYTQEMADNGEVPAVGMSFLLKNKNADKTWARPGFYPAKMKAIGDELFIVENGATCNDKKESVGSILDYLFSPIPAPIELINGNAYMFDYEGKQTIGLYYKLNDMFYMSDFSLSVKKCTNIRPMTVSESK